MNKTESSIDNQDNKSKMLYHREKTEQNEIKI